MVRTKFKSTPVNYSSIPIKSQTIPDQSMSIKELVRRFVKGIPADVIQRQPIFTNNSDFDLEKLGQLDPADKAYMAKEMQAENEANAREIQRAEDDRRRTREEDERKKADRGGAAKGSGIESLDNTMPDDTDVTNRNLGGRKTKSKQ